jgi:hypothetical protein
MKMLFRVFLSLCLFLLSGYSNMYADSNRSSLHLRAAIVLDKSENAKFVTTLQNISSDASVTTTVTDDENFRFFFEEDEEEPDKIFSLKRHPEQNNYHTGFYTSAIYDISKVAKNRYRYFAHFSIFSCQRYLLFQVIRV